MRPKGTTIFDYSSIKEIKDENGDILWIRKCPQCSRDIIHKNMTSARCCFREKRKCNKCGSWNRGLTKENNLSLKKMGELHSKRMIEYRKNNPPWNKGLTKYTSEIIDNNAKNHTGFKHDEFTKRIIGKHSEMFWKNKEYRNKVSKSVSENRSVDQWRKTMEDLGYFTPLSQKSEWDRYKQLVWYYTNQNDLSTLKNYNKRARVEISGSYSLDHKLSIKNGFKEGIDPKIVGSIDNLEFIPSMNNSIKNSKNSITKESLFKKYYGPNKN